MEKFTKLNNSYEWATFKNVTDGLQAIERLCMTKGLPCNISKSSLVIKLHANMFQGWQQLETYHAKQGMLKITLAGGQMSPEELEGLYDLIIDHEWYDVLTYNESITDIAGEYVKESYNYSKASIEDLMEVLFKTQIKNQDFIINNDFDFDLSISLNDLEKVNGKDKIVFSKKLLELGLKHFASDYGRKDLKQLLDNNEELNQVIEGAFKRIDKKQLQGWVE